MTKLAFIVCVAVFLWSCERPEPLAVYTPVPDVQFADARLAACATATARENQWPDAGRVTALRCNNAYGERISKLDGLENLGNLEYLDIAHNEVEDTAPLTELARLKFIDFSYNDLTTFAPPRTRQIAYLNADHNRIAKLDWITSFHALESLSLSHNRIADISALADKTTLRELDLSHNDIVNVASLAGLSNLRHLDLSRNRITDISALAGLTGLENLAISGNAGIDIVPISSMSNLTELTIEDSDLRDIHPLAALTKLQRVSLHGNRLRSVEPLFNLGGLTHIDVTDNPDLPCAELRRLVEIFMADVVQPTTCAELNAESE